VDAPVEDEDACSDIARIFQRNWVFIARHNGVTADDPGKPYEDDSTGWGPDWLSWRDLPEGNVAITNVTRRLPNM